MSRARLDKWNARYAAGTDSEDAAVAEPLAEALRFARTGRALDLACGAGRHSLWLAERGWNVDAVDGSAEGLRRLRAAAEARGRIDRIDVVECDLEAPGRSFRLEPDAYDLVADFFYLERDLFPEIARSLRVGGVFVAAIFCRRVGDAAAVTNPAFTLEAGELERVVRAWGFEVLHSREGDVPSAHGERSRHAGACVAEIIGRRV